MGKRLVNPDKLCMGCMEILDSAQKVCPRCGFSLSKYRQPVNTLSPYEILNGKYLVGKVIGVGGFGITYIGWDFYQSKRVCIKEYFPKDVAVRIPGTSTNGNTTSYSMEVYTANNVSQAQRIYMGGLNSYITEAENLSKFYLMPGIVSVRDFFYGNKTAYIVMEYIEGMDMKKLAKKCGGTIEPKFLFQMLKDVIRALYEIHKEGMIHRDISPNNIMVNLYYQAKVIDFGAAKDYYAGQRYEVLLKHGYAPVEQYYRDSTQGPWTDVYSLCATMYYLLSKVRLQKSCDRLDSDRTMPLSHLGVQVSPRQEHVIMKGLNVQPDRRYQSMAELYYDLYNENI